MSAPRGGDEALIERVHDATVAAYRLTVLRSGGRDVVVDGISCLIGTNPSPFIINTAARSGPVEDPAAALAAVIDVYGSLGHGFVLVTSELPDAQLEAAARSAAWRQIGDLPVMVTSHRVATPSTGAGVTIRSADPVDDLAAFRALAIAGFADTASDLAAVGSVFSSSVSLDPTDTRAFVASVDGVDAAVALVYEVGTTGIVAWVATDPRFRRRGLGSLVTATATNAGFAGGASLVALQASPLGAPVYAALGYEAIATDRLWIPPTL
jgi:ribosomal protein S18 acetylase RimI-like enzyme